MDVAFLVGFILLAIPLVSVLGLPFGMLVWLVLYGIVRTVGRALIWTVSRY